MNALASLVVILLVALAVFSWWLGTARAKQVEAEIELMSRSMHVSSCCNWASLNTSQAHPEVEIVCKAIETAFLRGELPDAAKLHFELTRLKAAAEKKVFTESSSGISHVEKPARR